ncbi:MAG: CsbD family protein [Bdellovibrionales bacterium]
MDQLTEVRRRIRQHWTHLTDNDIQAAERSWEELSGRLQETYGYQKDQAALEVERFKRTLKHSQIHLWQR